VATPDAPTVTDGECRSCGASVPDGQTKCRFCLTNHLGSGATSTNNETASTTFLGIVHLIVESTTFYGAVAKVVPRRTFSPPTRRSRPSTTTPLIYDPTRRAGAPAGRAMVSPTRYRCRPEEGEQLLSAARDGAGWHEQGSVGASGAGPCQGGSTTSMDGIRDASRLNAVLDDADDAVWLVPAMALTESAREDKTNSQVCRWYLRVRISIVKPVDGRPTTSSRSTSRSRLRRGRANRSGSAGCVVRPATTQSRVAPVLASINQHLYRCLRVSLVNTVISFNSGASLDGESICAGER